MRLHPRGSFGLCPRLPAAAWLLAAGLVLPATTGAATDPDIDPAEPIYLSVESEDAKVVVTHAQAYLQKSAEGLSYLRVDYAVANLGGEPVIGHRWNLSLQGIDTVVTSGAVLEPEKELDLSFLMFGSSVDKLDPGAGGGTLTLNGTTAAGSRERNCDMVFSKSQCQAIGREQQELCNGEKVGDGCDSGVMVCDESCFRDKAGRFCCAYDPRCVCVGRPAEMTLTEAIFEGQMPSQDPFIYPVLEDDRRLEIRPHHPGRP